MITKNDLELQFKQFTGLRKEHNPEKYAKWVEDYLLEELNSEKEVEEFMQNDFFIDGGER